MRHPGREVWTGSAPAAGADRAQSCSGIPQTHAAGKAFAPRPPPLSDGAMSTAALPVSPALASGAVALGGAIGALLRWHLGRWVTGTLGAQEVTHFPWPTLAANLIGSLAMGLLATWLARSGDIHAEGWRLFLGVGLLGGFTTFSAFSLEMMVLVERGAIGLALGYAFISVMMGLTALYAGLMLGRLT